MYCFSFDFCTSDESKSPTENLGQVLFGERIRPSKYEVYIFSFKFNFRFAKYLPLLDN